MEPLLEEVCRWMWALKMYSLTAIDYSLSLFPGCGWTCEQPASWSCCCHFWTAAIWNSELKQPFVRKLAFGHSIVS